jgi:hypothetical protein
VLVLALAPRLRREFRRPGLYALLGAFAVCTIPPIWWNASHAWATVGHLRSSGSLDDAPAFNPLELLEFLGAHFGTYSPLLFAALVWAVIASWRRAHQQLKGIFLLWMGVPVFALYLVLSLKNAANPNWDALAFLSLGVLASSYWRERIESRPHLVRWAAAAMILALLMSVLALHSDLIHRAGIHPRRDPSDKMRGWQTTARAVEEMRSNVEAQLGERVFLIADERERASEFAFYFRDKRVEQPGHPPVYIVESQDISNQFSFWPRYDEFVVGERPPTPDGEDAYTEEGGVNLFTGRSALYVQSSRKEEAPRNIVAGFQSVERVATIEVRRSGRLLRTLQLFVCRNYRTLPL